MRAVGAAASASGKWSRTVREADTSTNRDGQVGRGTAGEVVWRVRTMMSAVDAALDGSLKSALGSTSERKARRSGRTQATTKAGAKRRKTGSLAKRRQRQRWKTGGYRGKSGSLGASTER